MGVVLSGGQSQRFALARLIGQDFGLLLLDEPSGALEPLAEHDLLELLYTNATGTALIVAHRLSTVQGADRIYVMHNGEIVESGTHGELLQRRGRYYQMFSVQAESYRTGNDAPASCCPP